MADDKVITATDFPAQAFPITIQIYETETNEIVWEETVYDPPVVLEIPGKATFGTQVEVRVITGDGGYSDTQGNDGFAR